MSTPQVQQGNRDFFVHSDISARTAFSPCSPSHCGEENLSCAGQMLQVLIGNRLLAPTWLEDTVPNVGSATKQHSGPVPCTQTASFKAWGTPGLQHHLCSRCPSPLVQAGASLPLCLHLSPGSRSCIFAHRCAEINRAGQRSDSKEAGDKQETTSRGTG